MTWRFSGAGTCLWRRPAGLQRNCMWSCRYRSQWLAGLSCWRLHKNRLADVRGSNTWTAPRATGPKHGVELPWGGLEAPGKTRITHTVCNYQLGFGCKEKTDRGKERNIIYHLGGRLFLMQCSKIPMTRSINTTEPAASDTVNTNRPVSETNKQKFWLKKRIKQGGWSLRRQNCTNVIISWPVGEFH